MLRTVTLLIVNLTVALVLAASLMPVTVVLVPFVRSTPVAGYIAFAFAAALFFGMNLALWRLVRKSGHDG